MGQVFKKQVQDMPIRLGRKDSLESKKKKREK